MVFTCKEDVLEEILRCQEEAYEKGFNVGEAIYKQIRFFGNESILVDREIQRKIKVYQYCLTSNTPPYPSLAETPALFMDDYMDIHNEIENVKQCLQDEQERKAKAKNNAK